MSEQCKYCDICRTRVVCWPQILTILGPRDMCPACYFRYRELLEDLVNFFETASSTKPAP
jgi:hypothetical protein